jgi:hypothetical protein
MSTYRYRSKSADRSSRRLIDSNANVPFAYEIWRPGVQITRALRWICERQSGIGNVSERSRGKEVYRPVGRIRVSPLHLRMRQAEIVGSSRIRCTKCKEHFDLITTDLLVHYKRATALLEADAKGRDGNVVLVPAIQD